MNGCLRLFGLSASKKFARKVADYLDVELSKHVEDYFADREPYLRSEVNVRNCDVYVIQSLYSDEKESVSDKFIKLLLFIGSLKDASARRVTAVIPYLAFSRMDRKTESRAPISTKYIAMMLESVGVDRLLTMDIHNLSALQNSFRVPTDNLEAKNLIAEHIAHNNTPENLVILSPDSGGMTRAKRFRNKLAKMLEVDVGLAYLDKTHEGKLIQGQEIIGVVGSRKVVIVDDMISSGSTLLECKKAIDLNGGILLAACATHGLFVGNVDENLSTIEQVVVTDTIEPKLKDMKKLHIISTAKIFGQAIRRIHEEGGSISDLLK